MCSRVNSKTKNTHVGCAHFDLICFAFSLSVFVSFDFGACGKMIACATSDIEKLEERTFDDISRQFTAETKKKNICKSFSILFCFHNRRRHFPVQSANQRSASRKTSVCHCRCHRQAMICNCFVISFSSVFLCIVEDDNTNSNETDSMIVDSNDSS